MAVFTTSLLKFCQQNNRANMLEEWNTDRNLPCSPDSISFGSHKKVWWKCAAGHEWKATVKSRSEGRMCPVCLNRVLAPGVNDLASTNPWVAAQWHPTKNGCLKPCDVFAGTLKTVWWICDEGHEWQAEIASRSSGAGCPICTGKKILPGCNDMATLFPNLAAEWDTERNTPLTPDCVSPYSNRRVWWKCSLGHEWQAVISSRTGSSCGCPYCTGRQVLKGFNDLGTCCPEVAREWHPVLNGNFKPDMVTVGCHKRVWWRCGEGHEWRAFIFSRTGPDKCGCPVCVGKSPRLKQAESCRPNK